MRLRLVLLGALVVSIIAAVLVVPRAFARITEKSPAKAAPGPALVLSQTLQTAVQEVPPPPILKAGPVTVSHKGFWSWSLLDRNTNQLTGSPNMSTQTNSTESMIKVWIVADFLRRTAEAGQTPSQARLKQASAAIRNSDDNAAQSLWNAGGGAPVGKRLVQTCGLTETKPQARWAYTQISARDAVRMGLCIGDGRAAGPKWTEWVLNEMRNVRGGVKDQPPGFCCTGGGHWGIIDGLPTNIAKDVSIKNGWTPIYADGLWHVNCLAVHKEFVLVVQVRFPIALGLQYGADLCKNVTQQLAHNAEDG
jgi:hypothetical protein